MGTYKWMRPMGSVDGTAIPYFRDELGHWKPYTSFNRSIPDNPIMSKGYATVLYWIKLGWTVDEGIGNI